MAPVSYGPQNAADYQEQIDRMTETYNEVILNAHNEVIYLDCTVRFLEYSSFWRRDTCFCSSGTYSWNGSIFLEW